MLRTTPMAKKKGTAITKTLIKEAENKNLKYRASVLKTASQNMSDEEIFKKFQIKNANSSIIGECVYNICQRLERQPSHKVILEMMPDKFRTN